MPAAEPWTAIPPAFAVEIGRERGSLAAEIVREIRAQIPEYARPLAGKFGLGIRLGVETALEEFADMVAGSGEPAPERMRIYRALGRGELAEGRSLDALQAAYRLGARIAWRRYARAARRAGMRQDQMVTLAEAVFAHIDMIASASVVGYAEAKADETSTLRRRRLRLLELIVGGADRETIDRAAAAAEWIAPRYVACAALGGPAVAGPDGPGRAFGGSELLDGFGPGARAMFGGRAESERLPEQVLADVDGPSACVILPCPAADCDAAVGRLLRERCAVVGPTVPFAMAADSLRWARAVRERLPERPAWSEPVWCDRHLPALLLLEDEPLVRLISERRLGVLDGLTVKQRQRLETTLLAWLDTNRGSAPQVAARLGVHPQTARHRLHRVQQLFGPALADPAARFELEVALRGRLALSEFAESADKSPEDPDDGHWSG